MRINANIMAVNTQRQLFGSQTAGAKSMEKLSSGFRINRAADDAAGLAISEKMRSQIRGLAQASRNAQDGISVMQTAEGALDEVHSMLQRMKELAVQSGNDSNQSLVDREAIQKEVNALAEEIDSISTKTQFNKMTLLDGSFKDKHFHVGANADQIINIKIDAMDVKGLGLVTKDTYDIPGTTGTKSEYETAAAFPNTLVVGKSIKLTVDNTTVTFTAGKDYATADELAKDLNKDAAIQNLGTFSADKTDATGKLKFVAKEDGAKKVKLENDIGMTGTFVTTGATAGAEKIGRMASETVEVRYEGTLTVPTTSKTVSVTIDGTKTDATVTPTAATVDALVTALNNDANIKAIGKFSNEAGYLKFTAKSTDAKDVSMSSTDTTLDGELKSAIAKTYSPSSSGGGKSDVEWRGINVLSRKEANKGMTDVQKAIETLASRRADLGAIQNRVEHTIKNLDNSHENLMAAESRIRHVDMAKEIIENTRQNILQQAATSMLAQANQAPQTVLQLLR